MQRLTLISEISINLQASNKKVRFNVGAYFIKQFKTKKIMFKTHTKNRFNTVKRV